MNPATCTVPSGDAPVRQASAEWLETKHGVRFAFWTHPAGHPTRAVLILPPLFEERKSCARILAQTARHLSAEGACTLRMDYDGQGDSPGVTSGPAQWVADIRAAHAALRDRCPGCSIGWLTVRFATRLALAALDPVTGPAYWFAWAPVLCGTRHVSEWLQRHRIQQLMTGRSGTSVAQAMQSIQAGQPVPLDGVDLDAELLDALKGLKAEPAPDAMRMVTMPMRMEAWFPHADSRTVAALCAWISGTTTTVGGTAPFWHAVGMVDTQDLEDQTVRQFGAALSGKSQDGGASDMPPARIAGPSNHPWTKVPADGVRIVTFGVADRFLSGLYHPPAPDSTPVGLLLLMHGWAGCRLGPQRWFVRMATALAARGFGCLRFDCRGRGDSQAPRHRAVSVMTQSDDAVAAVAVLRACHPQTLPVTVLGICSGTKAAMRLAVTDPGVRRLVLLSAEPMGRLRPRTTAQRKTLQALRTYGHKLFRPESWRKMILGRLNPRMIRKAVLRHETRSNDEARFEDETLDALRTWSGEILFVFGGADPDAALAEARYRTFVDRHGLRACFHVVQGANHNFSDPAWEGQAMAAMRTFLSA